MWTCDLDMSYLEFGQVIFGHVMFWTCHIWKTMIMCRVNDLSGLCFFGMLIHFRSGEFQALDMSIFLAKVMPDFSVNFGMTCARK